PGYQTPTAIKAGEVSVSVKPSSVLSDKIVVRSVKVAAPDITFEGNLQGNNLSKILENIQGTTGGATSTPNKKDETGTKKKIEVDDFSITGGTMHLSQPLLGGRSANVVLPDIHLKDLGTGADGITPAELSEKVFKVLLEATSKAVTESMANLSKDATEAVKGLGKGATDDAN